MVTATRPFTSRSATACPVRSAPSSLSSVLGPPSPRKLRHHDLASGDMTLTVMVSPDRRKPTGVSIVLPERRPTYRMLIKPRRTNGPTRGASMRATNNLFMIPAMGEAKDPDAMWRRVSADLGGHRRRAGAGACCTDACGHHEAD